MPKGAKSKRKRDRNPFPGELSFVAAGGLAGFVPCVSAYSSR